MGAVQTARGVNQRISSAGSRISISALVIAVAILIWLEVCLSGLITSYLPHVSISLHLQELRHGTLQKPNSLRLIHPVDSNSGTANTASTGLSTKNDEYMARLRAAAAKPIKVVVMSAVFWKLSAAGTAGCSVEGIPLNCSLSMNTSEANLQTADALYYHAPSFHGQPRPKAFPDQLRLVMSLESAAYYTALDDPNYMCQFDAEMTYRRCAQVTNWYSLETFARLFKDSVVPFEEKEHAIAYINSNCGAKSGRSEIMRSLMALPGLKVPVHSLGRCDNNKPYPAKLSKHQVFRKYKFCVCMENSIRLDYVTEKLWDGLEAGCVPIYLGSSSARQYLPDRSAIVWYDPQGGGDASTPQELDSLLHEIGNNKTRYESMLAWKQRKPEQQPEPLFRHLWSVRHLSGDCMLCQFLAHHRANPKPRYTTCLFNSTWMAEAKQELKEDTCAAREKKELEELIQKQQQHVQGKQQQQ